MVERRESIPEPMDLPPLESKTDDTRLALLKEAYEIFLRFDPEYLDSFNELVKKIQEQQPHFIKDDHEFMLNVRDWLHILDERGGLTEAEENFLDDEPGPKKDPGGPIIDLHEKIVRYGDRWQL